MNSINCRRNKIRICDLAPFFGVRAEAAAGRKRFVPVIRKSRAAPGRPTTHFRQEFPDQPIFCRLLASRGAIGARARVAVDSIPTAGRRGSQWMYPEFGSPGITVTNARGMVFRANAEHTMGPDSWRWPQFFPGCPVRYQDHRNVQYPFCGTRSI